MIVLFSIIMGGAAAFFTDYGSYGIAWALVLIWVAGILLHD